ncbi:MAG: Holliday junction resolvase RuvX [Patescibacteria group bacterium]
MRILGIDYGERKVGVALGDTESKIASPWVILENEGHGETIKQIKLICEREQVDRVVVGIPHDMRNPQSETVQAGNVRRFILDLRSIGMPVDEIDEMLSTAQAQHAVQQSGALEDDAVAAAILLQSYLDKQK